MSLRLVYGRAGCGKSSFCLNDIKARLSGGGDDSLILIVPEQFTLQAEKNLVSTVGAGGILHAEVLSFQRMAYKVFNEVGGVVRRHMNSAGKCMLLYRIMESMKDSFTMFARAADQKGFVSKLSDIIAEFKRYNITPELLGKSDAASGSDELLQIKLKELGMIYSEFEQRLHSEYMDSDDDLTELSRRIEACERFRGAEVWIDEFSGFTPQEYLVIGKLLGMAKRVTICLCTDCTPSDGNGVDLSDVFSPSKKTVLKLSKLAEHMGVKTEEAVQLEGGDKARFRDSAELLHLERQYFSFPYVRYPGPTTDIGLFIALNIYSEVEDTARDIIRLCRDRGLRFRDIAVTTRNLEGYGKLISAVFREYGIPFFIDSKRDIASHPLIILVNSVMDIFNENWSYEAVFRYLKTGLTGVAQEDVDLLEEYVLACGIRGSMWTKGNWNYRMDTSFGGDDMSDEDKDRLEKLNLLRAAITQPLLKFKEKTRRRRSAKEICTALFDFLCDIGAPQQVEDLVEEFREAGELDISNEYRQVWNIVMEVFDQIVEVMGEEAVTLEKFSGVLAIGFGEYKIGLIPPALDQVLVGSIERSKSHAISALYILGVNDGLFPAAADDEGLLSDADRDRMRAAGLEMAQDTRTRAFEEQYLVYTTLTTPGRYLRVSCPIADHEGKSMRPSIIVSRLRKLFPDITEESDISTGVVRDGIELVTLPIPTFNHLVSAVRRKAEGQEIDAVWRYVYCWYLSGKEWKERCDSALRGLSYTNIDKPVSAERVRALYGSPMHSSVSRMESFACCPFSFFVKYGLKARERKIFRLTPPDMGTFMHTVIDMFSRSLDRKGVTWRTMDRVWCEKEVSAIVDELLEKLPGWVMNSSERYKYVARRLKRVLTRALWLISEQIRGGSFEPVGYEMDFGQGGQFSPIKIELPDGEQILLTGRIDRIDAMPAEDGTYLRIVDYKSGVKAFKLADVYYGLQIQLLTYMDAIWENGIPGLPQPIQPAGMLYFRIDDPIIRSNGQATEEEIEKAIMKQLKMKGLLLADVRVIRDMDRNIQGDSLIVPARINKDGSLGRSSAATMKQFQLLRRYVRWLLAKLGEDILKGDVSIKPYKRRKSTPCSYCSYSAVCQFDPSLKDNSYKLLHDMKDENVWGAISSQCGNAGRGCDE